MKYFIKQAVGPPILKLDDSSFKKIYGNSPGGVFHTDVSFISTIGKNLKNLSREDSSKAKEIIKKIKNKPFEQAPSAIVFPKSLSERDPLLNRMALRHELTHWLQEKKRSKEIMDYSILSRKSGKRAAIFKYPTRAIKELILKKSPKTYFTLSTLKDELGAYRKMFPKFKSIKYTI